LVGVRVGGGTGVDCLLRLLGWVLPGLGVGIRLLTAASECTWLWLGHLGSGGEVDPYLGLLKLLDWQGHLHKWYRRPQLEEYSR